MQAPFPNFDLNNIRWHPTYGHLLASASLDHTARIWSVFDTPGEVVSVEHSEGVKDVQWTCDGTKLLSGGLDKYVNVSDLESGKIIHSYHHTEWISSLCPHPTNPNIFLSGATRRGIVCWDMRINRVVREYFGRFGEVQDMTFLDSNGYSFVSTAEIVRRNSQDQGIIVWDCKSGVRLSNQVYIEGYTCTCVRKHPIENVFIAQSAAGYIASFESTKPYRLDVRKRYEGHQANGFKIGCSFSGDGKTIVSGCSSGEVVFYDTKSSKVVKRMDVGAKEATLSVAWHPLLVSTVAVSSWDGSIRILQ
ncbi:uncharacterized protein [Blastocystis hominis]|uniref:Uncharacterized protein n=1 Tax=Blastocystis hominis TaxID=12968 RepID=D8M1Q7_BLAHO|nr:uncharacterized protein [Blastocystis hominis]CBK21996.2 unnamed protein product [Blastocystis hominis]|eukprot:XP_012896044.1 uncharacterized protein [Blastocystis hominis]